MTKLDLSVRKLALLLLLTLPLAACGSDDDDGTGPSGNTDPVAMLTTSHQSVPAGDNHQTIVTLDASGSTDADGDPLTFSWTVPGGDFENGTSSSDATIQVSFPGAAPYTVTVTVSDGNGGSDSASTTITVG